MPRCEADFFVSSPKADPQFLQAKRPAADSRIITTKKSLIIFTKIIIFYYLYLNYNDRKFKVNRNSFEICCERLLIRNF